MLALELNEREIEIIGLLAEGLANKEIAERLFLAPNTVKWYVKQLNSKLGTSNRDEIVQAMQNQELLNQTKVEKPPYQIPRSNLPRQSTPFVGRDAELDELYTILEKRDLRLITILAQGGMGKTRLALEAGEQQRNKFRDGVFFVGLQALGSFDEQLVSVLRQFIKMLREGYSLFQCFEYMAENAPEPTGENSRQLLKDLRAGNDFSAALDAMKARVRSAYLGRLVSILQAQFREGGNLAERLDKLEAEFRQELGDLRWSNKREYAEQLIIPAIAESLYFNFLADGRSQKEQLLSFLADKEMLLLIDNWEHLLDGAPLLNEILQAAPRVKILATSREKLQLLGETVYVLRGMEFPSWESPEDALNYDSVQLLVQAAQRVKPDWKLNRDNLDFVSRICRLTQGMPLGILLAISWLDMLSLEEIAGEIEASADFLEAQFADVSERQQSIRVIFNYAWNKLSEDEQQVFMKLSIFRGGFNRDAAKEVAGAKLQNLHRLMEKALVMRVENERYDLHELLRQYAQEQLLQSGEADTVRNKHAAYYLKLLIDSTEALYDSRQGETFEYIQADFDNLRSAWLFAVDTEEFEFLAEAVESFVTVADYGFLFNTALDCILAAMNRLKAKGETKTLLYARFQIYQADCLLELSPQFADVQYCREELEAALQIAEAEHAQFEIYKAKRLLVQAHKTIGAEDETLLQFAHEAHEAAKTLGHPRYFASSLAFLGYTSFNTKDWKKSLSYIVQSQELYKELNNPSQQFAQLYRLGLYYWFCNELDKAEVYLRQAMKGQQESLLPSFSLYSQFNFGIFLYCQAQLDEAEEHLQAVYQKAKYSNNLVAIRGAGLRLAELHASKGLFKEALDAVRAIIPADRDALGQIYLVPFLGMNGEINEMRRLCLAAAEIKAPQFSYYELLQVVDLFGLIALLEADWGTLRAAECLSMILNHSHCPKIYAVHAYTRKCLHEYRARLGDDAFEAAWERGKQLDLGKICAEVSEFYKNDKPGGKGI